MIELIESNFRGNLHIITLFDKEGKLIFTHFSVNYCFSLCLPPELKINKTIGSKKIKNGTKKKAVDKCVATNTNDRIFRNQIIHSTFTIRIFLVEIEKIKNKIKKNSGCKMFAT